MIAFPGTRTWRPVKYVVEKHSIGRVTLPFVHLQAVAVAAMVAMAVEAVEEEEIVAEEADEP
jgi:hypothetical protein